VRFPVLDARHYRSNQQRNVTCAAPFGRAVQLRHEMLSALRSSIMRSMDATVTGALGGRDVVQCEIPSKLTVDTSVRSCRLY
jgi:hypothetical protein